MSVLPEVSILVATRDRARRLDAFFAAVSRLAVHPPWELIIVDNGSRDDTAAVLRRHRDLLGDRVVLLSLPRPGKSRALNAALRVARGRLLAFTDDDCYVAPDYVAQIVEVFARRAVDFAGGRMLPFTPGDARHAVWTSRVTLRLPPGSCLAPGFIQGGNLIVTRRLIDAVGGFDERLGPGTPFGCEDIDLVARASELGFAGGVFPGPTVHHHHGRDTRALRRSRQRFYDAGRGAHYCKRIFTGTMPREHAARWLRGLRPGRLLMFAREVVGALRYLAGGVGGGTGRAP